MLELLAFPVAIILGFLAGLGVGGGSILMLWLTVVMGMPYADARTINLLFFLPTAVICSFFRRRQNTLNTKKILPAIVCGCLAAAVSSYVSKTIDTALLSKFFGVLLLATGLREIFYRPRNAR